MVNNKNSLVKKGKVDIDRDILLSIINLATKEINGVHSLTNAELPILRKISKSKSEGVSIKFDTNGALNVDVYIIVNIGYAVPDIAYRVQENIKNSLNSMVGIKPGKINVHVCGVNCDEAGVWESKQENWHLNWFLKDFSSKKVILSTRSFLRYWRKKRIKSFQKNLF